MNSDDPFIFPGVWLRGTYELNHFFLIFSQLQKQSPSHQRIRNKWRISLIHFPSAECCCHHHHHHHHHYSSMHAITHSSIVFRMIDSPILICYSGCQNRVSCDLCFRRSVTKSRLRILYGRSESLHFPSAAEMSLII